MEKEILYLKTLFCCSACDGEIAQEEIDLIKSLVSNSTLFSGLKVESMLNNWVHELNEKGTIFLSSYLDSIKEYGLTDEEQLQIVRLAIEMIEADNQILYSEVKFFKRIRQKLSISDDKILEQHPDKEDFLLPDIIEPFDKFDWQYNFAEIKLT